jgi:hypothetical protein
MMYQDKFVAVVKASGRILRERDKNGDGASVYLPFGSEYSLSFKNLHSRKALVGVTIDGTDVLNGSGLIVDPNKEINLERFLERMDKGNRFRFIKKIQEIVEHRGDKIDDGIIRIEWQYEQAPVDIYGSGNGFLRHFVNPNVFYNHQVGSGIAGTDGINTVYGTSGIAGPTGAVGPRGPEGCSGETKTSAALFSTDSLNFCDQSYDRQEINSDEGLTVKGSVSKQQFRNGYIGRLESEKHVLTFMLKGTDASLNEVSEPITVKTKLKCGTCGTTAESTQNFCGKCSAALSLVV